ncbi:hypothetical protein ACGI40_00600 [Escherichia coli]|uniref:hypothetical protein n=1 Tax=Escherichia coli TaxID=562 RepID=UPI000D15108D|nr:hypothetical protein [Escherichia coli]PSY42506.1 hypothetical protein C7B19_26630 [Escherichia coli]
MDAKKLSMLTFFLLNRQRIWGRQSHPAVRSTPPASHEHFLLEDFIKNSNRPKFKFHKNKELE